MSNSSLANYKLISPNRTSPRNHEIDTITIHCVVGQASVETLGKGFAKASRKASSNYGIGYDGKIGMYVEECDRSWCSSSAANDNRAITIEVASDNTPPYAVNEVAYKSLIKLLVDICKRNNIKELKWKADKNLVGQVDKQNMTVHKWFIATSCPGEYLYKLHGQIAQDVNTQLGSKECFRVQTGAYRNKDYANGAYDKVKAAGFTPSIVYSGGFYKIQVGAYSTKANAVAMGKKLQKAGFTPYITINAGIAVPVVKKTIDELAKEVIQGKWGSGVDRKNRLTKAGYDYAAVQKRVNELL